MRRIANICSYKSEGTITYSERTTRIELGSIEPNSKKHRNIEKVRIPQTHVKFGSIGREKFFSHDNDSFDYRNVD